MIFREIAQLMEHANYSINFFLYILASNNYRYSTWAALCEKFPNVLSRCHTKRKKKKEKMQKFKDVPGGFPKSDLLGVTVALIHVAAQRFLAV